MNNLLFIWLCHSGYDAQTQIKCQEVVKSTIKEWQIYRTLKEKQEEYQWEAEKKLTKTGFWLATTAIVSLSTQRLYLTGHNIKGIDSVNLKLGKESEISLTWSF